MAADAKLFGTGMRQNIGARNANGHRKDAQQHYKPNRQFPVLKQL